MIKIGDKINMVLPNQNGEMVNLNDFLGKKVVLYFYPKDNTSGCTLQAIEYKHLYPEFVNLNTEILAISKDNTRSHAKFSCDQNLPFDLLTDQGLEFTENLGFLGEKTMYGRKYYGTIRSSVILDEQGIVVQVNYKVKPEEDAKKVLEFIKGSLK